MQMVIQAVFSSHQLLQLFSVSGLMSCCYQMTNSLVVRSNFVGSMTVRWQEGIHSGFGDWLTVGNDTSVSDTVLALTVLNCYLFTLLNSSRLDCIGVDVSCVYR